MSKIYQPLVISRTNEIIQSLTESDFFKDNDIENKEFAFNYFCDTLTEKFIVGELTEDEPIFTEDEILEKLNEVIIGSHLYRLKEKGLIESYSDENNEEVFFLTDKGKEIASQLGDKTDEELDKLI